MKEMNSDQLEIVTGGTSPMYPPMKHTEFMGRTNEKSVFPSIGRHGMPVGNEPEADFLVKIRDIIEPAKTQF